MGSTIGLKLSVEEEEQIQRLTRKGYTKSQILREALQLFLKNENGSSSTFDSSNHSLSKKETVSSLDSTVIELMQKQLEEARKQNNLLFSEYAHLVREVLCFMPTKQSESTNSHTQNTDKNNASAKPSKPNFFRM